MSSNNLNNTTDNANNLKSKINENYIYPDTSDPNFQGKIYKKREFYYHKYPEGKNLKNYDDIKEYRENICARNFTKHEHQALVSNFINPNTPYKSLILFHGLGTGKCVEKNTYVQINGIYENAEKIWHKYKTDISYDGTGEWSEPGKILFVNSLENNKICSKKVVKLYREKINSQIKQITLENGRQINVTNNHKLFVNGEWTNHLKIGDSVAIPYFLKNDSNNIMLSKKLCQMMAYYLTYYEKQHEKKNIKYEILEIYKKMNQKHQECDEFSEYFKNCTNIWKILSKISLKNIRKILLKFIVNKLKESIFPLKIYETKSNILEFENLFKLFGIALEIDFHNNVITINQKHYDALKTSKNIIVTPKYYYYDKIKQINYLAYNDYVYDLEIEESHNYIAEGIICHNTCAAISIAENFKEMVQKYNTKIYVLVSGPLIRENWKNELLTCTGDTYVKYQDKNQYMSQEEKQQVEKMGINNALQYYRFMSYKSFYKRVLGEKIVERRVSDDDKVKVSYRKTEEGEFERDIAVDRIISLDNTLIIVDEAHNLTGNAYGEALLQVLRNSKNTRLLLLTATPMKNLADDIIEMLNFARPADSPVDRDKVFTNNKIHLLEFKLGGIEYLKNMANGYISHIRGADPLIFATRIDRGVIPKGLLFTKVIRCKMMPFQRKIYEQTVKITEEDALDRKSEAVANFAFPALGQNKNELTGVFGKDGISILKNQLRNNEDILNKKIATEILNNPSLTELIYISNDGKGITGNIMKYDNLKHFSIKFYSALNKLNKLVWGKKKPRTAFVYSNLVKVGIELFELVLKQNGYLEYQEQESYYQINSDTVCYYCGKRYSQHNKPEQMIVQDDEINIDDGDDDVYDKSNIGKSIPNHVFKPATYIAVTGKSTEDAVEFMTEDKQRILRNVYSNIENYEGKYIKLVLGSKVMNEGISLKNVAEVHMLDVYFNLGKVDQTVGRAIRQCSHFKLMNENNVYPYVNVYKYVVSLDDDNLSTEEELYKKAEMKYILVKKTERILKEVAIDCPLNSHGNVFQEEIIKNENCVEPNENNTNKNIICPAVCDYTKCYYKCNDVKLNYEYYDPSRKIYKKLPKNQIDYSTFTNNLARSEIEYSKRKIKEFFITKYESNLDDILKYVKNSYSEEKRELFDDFFVYKALDELIPINENDFNNFKDVLIDKYNRPGYLIYRSKYYIFQPFDQNENTSIYYRSTYDKPLYDKLSLRNFLKYMPEYITYKNNLKKKNQTAITIETIKYDFDKTMDYYDSRPEFEYVGIIDKQTLRKTTTDETKDVFKIREKRSKILDKKRGTGIQNLFGAVCNTSKNKEYLENIAKKLEIDIKKLETRDNICEKIKEKMIFLEKYSLGKNKMTYVMIPINHPDLPFPLNLEDRTEYIIDQIKNKINFKLNIKIDKIKIKNMFKFEIIIEHSDKLNNYTDLLKSFGAIKNKNTYVITVE